MKSVLLIRHAKSNWDDASVTDFARPLDALGKNDASLMANRLLIKGVTVDYILCSPAKRARKTAEYFLEAYNLNINRLAFRDSLYEPMQSAFAEAIESAPDEFQNIALFSHNPGITFFVNSLTDSVRIDNIPTCGIFGIKVELEKWKNFNTSKPEFWFFDSPKYPG
ncbi:MAG: histidine phosphatase family protein [Bacteroidetes bacterium]|nr:histidine phosphatase family protein [Bacteroidota bacterium]